MNKPKIDPKFSLESKHFYLCQPQLADVLHVFSATRFPGFNDGMLWEPPESPEQIEASLYRTLKAWDEVRGFAFSIYAKTDDAFLGRILIRETPDRIVWNVGFWTHPIHQGKGIMTEALATILEFGFLILEAAYIEADYAIWNKASERVLHKNGFEFVEHIPQGFQKKGVWIAENKVMIGKEAWVKLNIDLKE
ncbi:MAG: GNAT family N-acetyltransferase [Bacteroidota bacterium]